MAIDFAHLSITVKRDDVPKATAELDRLTAAGDRAEKSTQKLASANNTAGVSSIAATRNMGAWAAMQAESAGHVGEHSLAIGRLERALAGIVGHFAGANAAAELFASGLLKFSVGTLETVGILGGLALVIGLYEKLTEGAREAKKQMDDMTDSLLNQARAAEEATVAGRENLLLIAQVNQQTVNKESGIGWRSILGSIVTGRSFLSGTDAETQEGRRQDAASAVVQAQKNRDDAVEAAHQKELDRLKKIDEERAKQQALLIRYNEMLERAYGGTFDISPDARGPRSTWRANGQSMSDDERAAINKSLGLNPNGSVVIPTVSMPNVSLTGSMTDLQQRFFALLHPIDAVAEAAMRLAESLQHSKDRFAIGKENWKPGNIGSGIEAGVTGAIGDVLSSFSPQAIALNLTSKAIGFAVNGLTQLGASLLGVGASATEARRAQRQLTDEYNAAVASFRHDDLAAMLAQNLATYEQLIKQTNDTLGNVSTLIHGGADAFNAYKKAIADLSEQAQRNAALATQQAQEQKQYAQEDLNIRNLRATGRGDEANLLAYKERQQREYQAAVEKALSDGVLDLAERLYLQTLATTQANELIAEQNGLLSDALRNAPSGFYGVAGYVGAYATPRTPAGYPTDSGARPYTGNGGTYGGGGGTNSQQPQVIILQADGKVLARVVVNALDKYGSATNGAGSARSDALNNYPA